MNKQNEAATKPTRIDVCVCTYRRPELEDTLLSLGALTIPPHTAVRVIVAGSRSAAVSAWLVAAILTLLGDRGVAVGVALVGGLGLSVAAGFVAVRWIATNDWPLW